MEVKTNSYCLCVIEYKVYVLRVGMSTEWSYFIGINNWCKMVKNGGGGGGGSTLIVVIVCNSY